jgi:hypothetical protein
MKYEEKNKRIVNPSSDVVPGELTWTSGWGNIVSGMDDANCKMWHTNGHDPHHNDIQDNGTQHKHKQNATI